MLLDHPHVLQSAGPHAEVGRPPGASEEGAEEGQGVMGGGRLKRRSP